MLMGLSQPAGITLELEETLIQKEDAEKDD
jgi:hypothetical protein